MIVPFGKCIMLAVVDNLVNIVGTLVLQLTQNPAEQQIHNNLTKIWQEKIEKTITQLQQPLKAKDNSFTLSSPDLKELPPHMSSTPKSENIPTPHIEQTVQPLQKSKQHLDEGILLQQPTKLRETQPPTSDNDYSMDKLFMKDLPPTSSWMTFSGEGEYEHMEFIDWVDRLKTDFHMTDAFQS